MSVTVAFDPPPIDTKVLDSSGSLTPEWVNWLTQLELLLNEQVQQINNSLS